MASHVYPALQVRFSKFCGFQLPHELADFLGQILAFVHQRDLVG
jgi:hypothetical protein